MKTTLFPKAFAVLSLSILLLGLAVPDLDAAVVTNIFTGAGSTNIASYSFSGDSNSYLEISGGFQMTNTSAVFGNATSAKNMVGLVAGSNTYWQAGSGNWFDVGSAGGGSDNTLTISNGARVFTPGFLMGRVASAANNRVVVSGSGTVLTNGNLGYYVGYNASGESLVIRDGASFYGAGAEAIGFNPGVASSNNLIWVSGAGSLYRSGGDVQLGIGVGTWGNQFVVDGGAFLSMPSANVEVGSTGGGSSLLVTNGGHVGANAIHVSKTSTSSNNTVLISGAGSTVTNAAGLYMGYSAGRDGQVIVSNSGNFSAATAYIGYDIASKGQKVTVVSTGSMVASTLYVGYNGSSNVLTISDGGTVNPGISDAYIGFSASSSNNAMVVTSGGQFIKGAGDLDVGYNGVNNLLLVSNGGLVNLSAANLYVGKNAGSSGSVVLSGRGSRLSVGASQYVLVGSNTYGRGSGNVTVLDGATLSSGTQGLEAGFAGTGVISNDGGVYEFVVATPSIKPNTAGAISLNNGWVSFKNVANAAVDGQITNISFTGANTLRLDNSTNAALAYTIGSGSRFSALELVNGNPLWQGSSLLIGSGGSLLASNAMATIGAVLTNAGSVSVVNGQLTYLANVVLNGGTFTLRNGTNQFNQGLSMASGSSLTVTGGATRMTGAITNSAGSTIQALNSVVTWAGPVVIGGRYYSDPSTNVFATNVTVTASGSLYGSNGDLFVFNSDLAIQSTNRTDFNLVAAQVLFTNASFHNLNLTGSGALDKGSNWLSIADLATNFAIGTMSIAANNKVVVQGDTGVNALYVGWLDIQGIQTNTYANLTNGIFAALGLPSINMYYDEHVGGNAYLQGQTYNLWGGSLLIPIPEPSAWVAVGSGIALLLFLRRRAV